MTARERRVLVAGAAVVGAVLLVQLVMWGGDEAATRTMAAQQAGRLLERARTVLDAAPAWPESLTVHNARLVARTPLLLAGSQPTEATANLSSLLGGWASQAGARITQVVPRPDSQAGGFVRVGLLVQLEGGIDGVTGVLRRIESDTPLLTVDRLDIARDPRDGAQLRATLVVSGWALPGGGS